MDSDSGYPFQTPHEFDRHYIDQEPFSAISELPPFSASDLGEFSSVFNEFEEIANGYSSFDPPLPLAQPLPPLPPVYDDTDMDVKPFHSCLSTVSGFSVSGCAEFANFPPPLFYEDMLFDIKPERDPVPRVSAFSCGNSCNDTILAGKEEEESGGRGRRKAAQLEVEEIQKYFDMPINRAAKEMNVGITLLKKRCRELNIMRWPHRKIKSLKTLINNVKDMGLSREDVMMLEDHKRLLEKVPDMELSERTKKLRQACFKANYKKRMLYTLANVPF